MLDSIVKHNCLLRSNQAIGTNDPADVGLCLGFALWAQRGSPFWIGDLIVYAESQWGDDFYQHVEESDWSMEMIERYAGVARAVPRQNRVEGLSWTHHSYVAKVPIARQRELLVHAKSAGMTSKAFLDYVRERKPEWAAGNQGTKKS